ncbi:MAG: roadblock/LC7 domain-containing protein [Candidatus Ranarchaeia archaeon]|jgi:predicted regulator of Ras-like GTPase activity (Roadblock/LC7/MglB family)
MNGTNDVGRYLSSIKSVRGVENVVLTQQDGVPIQSAGVWLSKDDIFKVSSATSAIFAAAQRIHPDLEYILLEGNTSKIVIAPLPLTNYYLAITANPVVNLGAIFLYVYRAVDPIKNIITSHAYAENAPLRAFNSTEINKIQKSFAIRPGSSENKQHLSFDINISLDLSERLDQQIERFVNKIPGVRTSAVILKGGYLLAATDPEWGPNAPMTFSLYDTSVRLGWLMRKAMVDRVLCKTGKTQHFIHKLEDAVFSTEVMSDQVRLGMVRLLLPSFIKTINQILRSAKQYERKIPITLDLDGPLIFQTKVEGSQIQ